MGKSFYSDPKYSLVPLILGVPLHLFGDTQFCQWVPLVVIVHPEAIPSILLLLSPWLILTLLLYSRSRKLQEKRSE
jgi:hypothetical protein